jgi:hypothetical protein
MNPRPVVVGRSVKSSPVVSWIARIGPAGGRYSSASRRRASRMPSQACVPEPEVTEFECLSHSVLTNNVDIWSELKGNDKLASEVKARQPSSNCRHTVLPSVNNPHQVPDPNASPYTVAPEYDNGTCVTQNQFEFHTEWSDGNWRGLGTVAGNDLVGGDGY